MKKGHELERMQGGIWEILEGRPGRVKPFKITISKINNSFMAINFVRNKSNEDLKLEDKIELFI